MSSVTYKSLHQLVVETIESQMNYSQSLRGSDQLKRSSIAPLAGNALSDITSASIVTSIQTLLSDIIKPRIISGLHVRATNPISNKIIVEIGSGVSYGRYYELHDETTLTIPFDNKTEIFYIVLFDNTIMIDRDYSFKKLVLAKIIVPQPGTTAFIVNNKDSESSYDAYIVNQRDYDLHGDKYGKFEEDTVELLRDNISPILADNLIGNIRLSEDLKITNSSGSLELDSREMRLKSTNGNRLMRLNKNGTFFYDENGVEIARFSVDGARVGNIVVTKNSIQSGDFVSGALGTGFQIQDNGDAEFNNIRARGKFTTSVFEKETISSVGGNLLVADSDILDLDMTALDSSTLTITGDTTFDVGDILRIKDGVDDEWFEVTDVDLASNTYTVTRDKAGDYTSDLNPIWKKGTAVINYGSSTDGMIYMTASEANAPYMSVINTGTTPWIAPTTRLRVGNLNGFLGYTDDSYGIAIGDVNEYLKYDPVNGLRIKGDVTITSGTVIPVTFYQDEEPPTSGQTVKDGDYWVDTDDSNKLYLREADTWTVISQSGGGGGISSFVQSATASGEGVPTSLAEGDLWLNTDNNRLYRAVSSGADEITAGEWELTLSSVGSTPDIGEGLYLSADYLGYFNGTDWTAYIKNNGTFYFGSSLDSGGSPRHICWDGNELEVRGKIVADDIEAGEICLEKGICIRSNAYESGSSGYTIFDGTGLRSYNNTGDLRFSVEDGHIEAQDIRLQDPSCNCCYSYLDAGALRFHDENGDVPYANRMCSGQSNTGTTVCLQYWTKQPNILVGIQSLYSYNASQSAQNQQWSIYADCICCYCNSGNDYGYCFNVHAELRLASGQAGECLKQVAFGTSVCTDACVCSTKVRNKFLLWCNRDAPSNYYAGCLCYCLAYRKVGDVTWCECCYTYLQPHSSTSELKSEGETTDTLTFPCMATWEICGVCYGLCWHDTGICATTTITCTSSIMQCVTTCTGSCNYCMTCTHYGYGSASNPGYRYFECLLCWPTYTCNWCLFGGGNIAGNSCGTIQVCGYHRSLEIQCSRSRAVCACACGYNYNSSNCCYNWTGKCALCVNNPYVCICMYGCWSCSLTYMCAIWSWCTWGWCRVLCFCCLHNQGTADSCCTFCNHSLCNTYGCYCVLDPAGVLNWLAIAYV